MDIKALFTDYKWYIIGMAVVVLLMIILLVMRKSPSQDKSDQVQVEGFIARLAKKSHTIGFNPAEIVKVGEDYKALFALLTQTPPQVHLPLLATLYYDIYVERNLPELRKFLSAFKRHFKSEDADAALNWRQGQKATQEALFPAPPKKQTQKAEITQSEPQQQEEPIAIVEEETQAVESLDLPEPIIEIEDVDQTE